MQPLDTAKLRDVGVTRMRYYADDQLGIAGELLKVCQQLENKAKHNIRSISTIPGLQTATNYLSRWPGKDWRRRRASGAGVERIP